MIRQQGNSVGAVTHRSYVRLPARSMRGQAEALLKAQTELRRARSELRELAALLINSHEAERQKLARELHDELNQRLAMFQVDVERLNAIVTQPELNSALGSIRSGAKSLMTDVRKIAHHLHPSILDNLGLEVALRSYCVDFSAHEEIGVKYTVRNSLGSIPDDVALCLYRVCQEGLRNIAKHSRSKRAAVTVGRTTRNVRMTIRDWGVGFKLRPGKRGSGIGLLSIRERVRLVGGRVAIASRPEAGTQITVLIPVQKGRENEQGSSSPRG